MAEPLHRSRDDRMLAGVAAGVAETLDADPSLVRIVWALLAILSGGVAVLVYIVMAIVVPETPIEPWRPNVPAPGLPSTRTRSEWRAASRAARRARRQQGPGSGEAGLVFGVVLILVGALFLVREAIPWFDFHLWWPIGIIGLGVLLLVAAMRPRRPTG
ncbi:MAG: PspC domain-containing protein [Chloroflexi bacterium]|nr:PspC domain-containing protein [Chloroflexota bacterium]